MEEPEDGASDAASGGINPEQIKSYLAFARRAIRAHRWVVAGVLLVGLGLTIALAKYLPRTYECKTVLMALSSTVLDNRNDPGNALGGAEGLVKRHDNLEELIRSTDLVRKSELRRPPLLRFKDSVIVTLFGPMDDKTKVAVLLGTLESKIECSIEKNELTIGVTWSDPETAAELAEAARESFLRARHGAEISAFEDKMAILDGHASTLRQDIAIIANQLSAQSQAGTPPGNPGAATPAPTPAPVRAGVVRLAPKRMDGQMAEELTALKEKLATGKPKLAELENDWQRRQREAQAKLEDLKLRLTPSHPEVVTQQERVTQLSQVPSEVAALRAELKTLQTDIKAGELVAGARAGGGTVGGAAAAGTESLPAEVMQALAKDNADPAVKAQLSGAIIKYGDLRNEILSSKIELDTAQAAFNHRYQISVPAEVPNKPIKPKPALVIGGGLFLSLLLALLLPILMDLRKGVIVEAWQVNELQLPVLADLRLPPNSD